MWQILCQLKVSLSSDQYFNLNKPAQWGRTDGEAETPSGEKEGQNKQHKCQSCHSTGRATIYIFQKEWSASLVSGNIPDYRGIKPTAGRYSPKSILYTFATFTLK